jgi:hypothetical protein
MSRTSSAGRSIARLCLSAAAALYLTGMLLEPLAHVDATAFASDAAAGEGFGGPAGETPEPRRPHEGFDCPFCKLAGQAVLPAALPGLSAPAAEPRAVAATSFAEPSSRCHLSPAPRGPPLA